MTYSIRHLPSFSFLLLVVGSAQDMTFVVRYVRGNLQYGGVEKDILVCRLQKRLKEEVTL